MLQLVTQNEGAWSKAQRTRSTGRRYNTFTHRKVTVEPFPAYNKFHMKFMTTGFLIT